MICVFDPDNQAIYNTDADPGNGDAVLMPTVCRVNPVAGGKCDLTMTHPIDQYGKWEHLVEEAVILAPVPPETIETAFSGLEADEYLTTSAADLRSGPNEPESISYTAWDITVDYAVGNCVSYSGKNYKCIYFDETSAYAHIAPPNNPGWWRQITSSTPGDPIVTTLAAGASLYYVDEYGEDWYLMETPTGLRGYIKQNKVTFNRTLTPAETQPRTITDQFFRIRDVTVDTKSNQVQVTAEHVSYDLAGLLVIGMSASKVSVARAINQIEQCLEGTWRGTIATNLSESSDGEYTGEINGKNGIYALLDPDKGVVKQFDAALRRDNWDIFIMRKVAKNKGYQLRYGKNILGVNWKKNTDATVTRVIPVAKKEDGTDLFLTENGYSSHKYVAADNDGLFPVKRYKWLKVSGQVGKDDGTETDTVWTLATLQAEMEARAEEQFDKEHVNETLKELTVDFELLGDTVEYAQYKKLQEIAMYDQVEVFDDRIGLTATMIVSELEYDSIKKKLTAMKLSNVTNYTSRSVSGWNVNNNSITRDKLTDGAAADIIAAAVDEAISRMK